MTKVISRRGDQKERGAEPPGQGAFTGGILILQGTGGKKSGLERRGGEDVSVKMKLNLRGHVLDDRPSWKTGHAVKSKVGSLTREPVERRREKRFQIHGGGFAVLRPHLYKQGQIIDVGIGGLAFRYVTSIELPNESFQPNMSLDIFPPEYQTLGASITCCLHEVQVKAVSDFELARIPFGSTAQRRCSVAFRELTEDQKSQLEYFIQKYTLEEV